ncbi:IS3 family transposase [Mycetohabitans rhizoxinica]|uniref:IS3 family transposase n=1 Tax=Mycetohabitans rhizoxinica TaxID=412963 RepID=UPI0032433A3F
MSRYTEQQKLQVVEDYLSGQSGLKTVAKRHDVDISAVRSWVAAYREHGCAGLMKKQRVDYSAEFKLTVLKRMRSEGLSRRQVAAKFDIRLFKVVGEWERRYDEGGLEALAPRRRGLTKKMPTTVNSADLPVKAVQREARTQDELLAEVKQLRMENAYLKKLEALSSETQASAAEKARLVLELRHQYPLADLLKVAGLARSTFYYQHRALQRTDKYAELKARIRTLFHQHKGRYGYRRITATIRQDGIVINHKTIQRLMTELKLKCCVRVKKYRAYKGQIGHTAPNLLDRRFDAQRPNRKWVTDVTEFNVSGQKLYLSPVLDLYNGEIIAYETSRRPLFNMVERMLSKAIGRLQTHEKPMLHSDQGWQYRMPEYRRRLESRTITQSMSRRGNCLDNAAMESFFGTLKSEFYYPNKFRNIDELRAGLEDYIRYYNHDRIKLKLNGLSPVRYRIQFSQA